VKQTTIIFKPTDRCNARCVYCSAYGNHASPGTMSRETLETLFDRIEEWAQSSDELEEIKIIWHGGEPTLMPSDFFYAAIRRQEKIRSRYRLRVINLIQSNLLNLDQDRVELLKALLTDETGEVGPIGTSFDPFPDIRIAKQGDYNTRWRRSLDLLRQEGLPFGILYVVHKPGFLRMDEVLTQLLEEFPDVGFRFNPLYREGRAAKDDACRHLYITAAEWGDFLIRLYRHWEKRGKKPRWAPLRELESFHTEGNFRLSCNFSGQCASSHLGIDTDGNVYSCGRGIDRHHDCYGNIRSHSFRDIILNPQRQRMLNRTIYLKHTGCKDCPWWEYCHGGCAMDAIINHGDLFQKSNFCESRMKFFNTVYGEPAHGRSETSSAAPSGDRR